MNGFEDAVDEIADAPVGQRDVAIALLREIRDLLSRRLDDRLALGAEETAAAIGIGERLLWSRVSAGEFPEPVKIGGRSVWPVATIKRHLESLQKQK